MSRTGKPNYRGVARTVFDVLLILLLSTLAEAAHFSWQQGRHLICADSAQYVDGAEALLGTAPTAHFEFRKPGYAFILAGVALWLGNMGWAAVAVNHLFQALLPLAAYGLGRQLHSRLTGWTAAILLIAQLQVEHRADRIMSEAVFTTIFSFGMLALAVGLSKHRSIRWMAGAGLLLAMAWLTRSVAVAAIGAAILCALWLDRHAPRRALVSCLCLALPLLGAMLFESSLNLKYAGRFKPCTGTLGPTLLLRMRTFIGTPWSESEATKECLSLLPERSKEDAYLVNKLDGWVAWYRARHDRGMDEWAADSLMKRAAVEMIFDNPKAYAQSCARIFTRHLLRQGEQPSLATVRPDQRKPVLLPSDVADTEENREFWYAHWSLPKRTVEDSRNLVSHMRAESEQKAPFGNDGWWRTLRYYSMTPYATDALGVLRRIAALWPGFALLACGVLGLNRKTCALLALAYVLDAGIVALTAFTDGDIQRFKYIWLATDTTLAAALVTPFAQAIWEKMKKPIPEETEPKPE